jgi:hypothetical protein
MKQKKNIAKYCHNGEGDLSNIESNKFALRQTLKE